MSNRKKAKISLSMILFEFRTVTGNPYVHIFGIGMPVLLAIIIIRAVISEMPDNAPLENAVASVFLGIGTLIPLATILIGYSATYSQELEKGIPQRMSLFGISPIVTIINRLISEGIFLLIAYAIYFSVGFFVLDLSAPALSGFLCYALCSLLLGTISFFLAHSIASFFRKFGITYCISMILYFGIMILSGLMGISYESLPAPAQAVSRLLPTTYIARDFADVWAGKEYNFIPLLQSFLFTGALTGILLFITLKKTGRKQFFVMAPATAQTKLSK